MSTHRIAAVRADVERRRLRIHWKDGAVTTKDLARDIAERPLFAALGDAEMFASVRVLDGGYAIGWPDTEVAFAADGLWYEAHPSALPWPDAVMSPDDFKGWMQREHLSLSTTAALLDLSRRTIAYYASGERVVPRVVFLACMAVTSARTRAA